MNKAYFSLYSPHLLHSVETYVAGCLLGALPVPILGSTTLYRVMLSGPLWVESGLALSFAFIREIQQKSYCMSSVSAPHSRCLAVSAVTFLEPFPCHVAAERWPRQHRCQPTRHSSEAKLSYEPLRCQLTWETLGETSKETALTKPRPDCRPLESRTNKMSLFEASEF